MSERQEKFLTVIERGEGRGLSSDAPEDFRKQIFQESRELDERISGEEMELLETRQNLEETVNATWRKGESEKVTVKGDVTRTAVSGSRTSEIKAELFSADVDDRRVRRHRTGSLVIQDSTDSREAKVFRAHAAPQGMCDNLINALELLTSQQKDGDSPVGYFVAGLLERNRSGMMDRLRKFIPIHIYEAVKVGDLPENKVQESGKAKSSRQISQERLFGKARMSSPCEHMKRVCCAPPSILESGRPKTGASAS